MKRILIALFAIALFAIVCNFCDAKSPKDNFGNTWNTFTIESQTIDSQGNEVTEQHHWRTTFVHGQVMAYYDGLPCISMWKFKGKMRYGWTQKNQRKHVPTSTPFPAEEIYYHYFTKKKR